MSLPHLLPHLLLVDDSDTALEFERAILSPHYAISTASNGLEALEKLRQTRPAAVLLDLSMPGMDGEEVLERVLADPSLATIPVLIVSTESDRGEACVKRGAAGFLAKPIRRDDLLLTVGRILEEVRARAREGSVAILPLGVGTVNFGINLVHVRAVTLQCATRPLLAGPSYLADFIELHGQPICVLDLAERLGEEHAVPVADRKLVVTRDERLPLALCVNRVNDPEEIPFSAVTRLSRTPSEEEEPVSVAVEAVVTASQGPLPILNPQHLLSRGLRRRLPALLEAARASGRAPTS